MNRFTRYELRTTHPDAARSFYAQLLGHERVVIWPLHEQARARGAMPHWLGYISVAENSALEQMGKSFVERGAVQLGPTLVTPDRGQILILRDPGGAIVALNDMSLPLEDPVVAWHVLNTNNVADALRNYHDLFAWTVDENAAIGPHGAFYGFSWADAPSGHVGALADITGRPGVHPHWLFFFEVNDLDSALTLIHNAGGTATEPFPGPKGARLSVCEDQQGAAFGLYECREKHE